MPAVLALILPLHSPSASAFNFQPSAFCQGQYLSNHQFFDQGLSAWVPQVVPVLEPDSTNLHEHYISSRTTGTKALRVSLLSESH